MSASSSSEFGFDRSDRALLKRSSIPRRVLSHLVAWIGTTGILMLMVDAAAGNHQTPERLVRIAIQVGLVLAPSVYAAAWLVDRPSLSTPAKGLLAAGMVIVWPILCDPIQRRFGTGAPLYALVATTAMLVLAVLAVRGAIRGLRAESALSLAQQLRFAAERRLVGAELAPHTLHEMLDTLHAVAMASPDRTSALILDLALMMRHLVEGTRREFIAAAEEWAFIEAYGRFCEARGGIGARLALEFEGDDETPLPAMLVVTLLTNAVMLATDRQGKFDVRLSLLVRDSGFRLRISHAPNARGSALDEDFGVGMVLMRRRLDQLYPRRHRLTEREQDGRHELDIETW